jgi:hypothetical protein
MLSCALSCALYPSAERNNAFLRPGLGRLFLCESDSTAPKPGRRGLDTIFVFFLAFTFQECRRELMIRHFKVRKTLQSLLTLACLSLKDSCLSHLKCLINVKVFDLRTVFVCFSLYCFFSRSLPTLFLMLLWAASVNQGLQLHDRAEKRRQADPAAACALYREAIAAYQVLCLLTTRPRLQDCYLTHHTCFLLKATHTCRLQRINCQQTRTLWSCASIWVWPTAAWQIASKKWRLATGELWREMLVNAIVHAVLTLSS